HHVFVFKDQKTLIKASQLYLGMTSDSCALAGGDPSLFATWWDKSAFHSERNVYRHLVHHVSHLLLAVVHLKALLDEYGFVHEGLGHYFEMATFGTAGNTCNREAGAENMEGVDFEGEVARAARLGKYTPFATIATKRTVDLQGLDHVYAWSYAEFLISVNPQAMRELIVRLKQGKDLRASLKELFGFSFAELQEAWLAHVKEKYHETTDAAKGRPRR